MLVDVILNRTLRVQYSGMSNQLLIEHYNIESYTFY